MKIDSIKQQQNFKGSLANTAGSFIAKHPVAIAGLAGASVVAQKIVMSGSEATIGPCMDLLIGKTITKATGEKDGRTNQSSKVQAVRTASQSIGGTITGVAIRSLCILGATMAMSKLGGKAGSKIAEIVNPQKLSPDCDLHKFQKNAAAWGKSIGGAAAILVMTVTNFLLDVPLVNGINKKLSGIFLNKNNKADVKEAK